MSTTSRSSFPLIAHRSDDVVIILGDIGDIFEENLGVPSPSLGPPRGIFRIHCEHFMYCSAMTLPIPMRKCLRRYGDIQRIIVPTRSLFEFWRTPRIGKRNGKILSATGHRNYKTLPTTGVHWPFSQNVSSIHNGHLKQW